MTVSGTSPALRALTSGERFLLEWLSKEDDSALGECTGIALSGLVSLGFAEVTKVRPGIDPLYARVRLTEKGRAVLSEVS